MEESDNYALLRTKAGWVGIDPFNNPVPIHVLTSAIDNIGLVIKDRHKVEAKPTRTDSVGYIYCITYLLNGVKMIKIGRSNYKTRTDSYRHLESRKIVFVIKVDKQREYEKNLLKVVSNGRSEYIPYKRQTMELIKSYVGI